MSNPTSPFICVTTDYVEPDMEWEKRLYAEKGVDYRLHQLRKASADKLLEAASDAHVLVVDQARIDARVMKGLTNCRLIIRHGDGYDNLDLKAATEEGIVCANDPGFWSMEAAEQAFTLALALALKIPVQESVARSPTGEGAGWDLKRIMPYSSLASRTVGILGFGKIGRQVCKLFAPITKRVLVCDTSATSEFIRGFGGEAASFEDMLTQSDILSLHTPANDRTIGLFDASVLGRMKKGAILVNTARGTIVDTDALAAALSSGALGGAGLDSTDPEPLPGDHPLFSMQNVIITPHMGWYSEDALKRMRESIVDDVLNCREGKRPESIVNPDVLSSPKLRF